MLGGYLVAVASVIVGLVGLGIGSAGVYYVAADWGSTDGGEKARMYALLISGLIILAGVIGGVAYYLFVTPPIPKLPAGTSSAITAAAGAAAASGGAGGAAGVPAIPGIPGFAPAPAPSAITLVPLR